MGFFFCVGGNKSRAEATRGISLTEVSKEGEAFPLEGLYLIASPKQESPLPDPVTASLIFTFTQSGVSVV